MGSGIFTRTLPLHCTAHRKREGAVRKLKNNRSERVMEERGGVKKKAARIKRVCVFCGSTSGNRNSYSDAALQLAQELVPSFPSIPTSYIYILHFLDS